MLSRRPRSASLSPGPANRAEELCSCHSRAESLPFSFPFSPWPPFRIRQMAKKNCSPLFEILFSLRVPLEKLGTLARKSSLPFLSLLPRTKNFPAFHAGKAATKSRLPPPKERQKLFPPPKSQ